MYKKVFLTGVNGGIGRALTYEFRKKGIRVIGSDHLKNVDIELDDYIQIDLNSPLTIIPKLEEIFSRHSDIDLIFNNAGIANLQNFKSQSAEEFNRVMQINFNSLVTICRFGVNFFSKNKRGGIANMASMAGYISPSGLTSYSASKHAVVGFTESLIQEFKVSGRKIKIHLITPGFIETDIMQIGHKNGFPPEYKFIVTSPAKAAKKMVDSLLRGEEFIIPDTSGKVMKALNRFAPRVLEYSNRLVAKKINSK